MKESITIVREEIEEEAKIMMSSSCSWDQLKLLVRRNNNQPTTSSSMICKFPVTLFAVSLLFCFISFVLCTMAELLRNKEDEIRWIDNGRLCYAAPGPSYWLGIAALCFMALSQLLANFIFFNHSSKNPQFHLPLVPKLLVFISWVCCGVAIVNGGDKYEWRAEVWRRMVRRRLLHRQTRLFRCLLRFASYLPYFNIYFFLYN